MNIFNNFLYNYKRNPNKVILQLKNSNEEFTYSDIYKNSSNIIYLLKKKLKNCFLLNKLIIISQHHFTQKEFEKFNINYFIKENISTEIWVMNKLLKDKIIFSNMSSKKKFKIKNITSINELENNIKAQQKYDTAYQVYLKFELKTMNIFRLITKYNCKYSISPGLSNNYAKDINFFYITLIKEIFSLNFIYLYKKLISRISNFINKIIFKLKIKLIYFKAADFHYCRAKKYFIENKNHFLISKKTKIIWGHHKDYEFFIKKKN